MSAIPLEDRTLGHPIRYTSYFVKSINKNNIYLDG